MSLGCSDFQLLSEILKIRCYDNQPEKITKTGCALFLYCCCLFYFFLNKILPQDTCCKSASNPFPEPIQLMFDFEFFENDAKHKFLANLIFHSTHENASGAFICNFNGKTAMIRKINTFSHSLKVA